MPLTEWQGSLQGVTFGAGTNYRFDDRVGISGIGEGVKTVDVDLDHGNGAYAGTDRKASRVIMLPFVIIGSSPSDTMDNFETLAAAFVASSTDVTLELYLPGKHFSVSGRPRGIVEDIARLKSSVIRAMGRFDALDPTMTAL